MNTHFLKKLGEFFRSNFAQMSELTEDDLNAAIRQARAHAGGMQKAENMMSMSESFSRDGDWRLFFEREFAEPPAVIQVLPKPGTYSHPRYGKFTMTPEVIQKFVDNHNNHVYQEQVPIDAEHQSKMSGAVGYFGEMRVIDGGKGGAEANVTWTDRGREMIASDSFKYFSPEWFDEWADPVGGKKIANVLVGGAITTRPFFKDKVLRPLVASEDSYQAGEWYEYANEDREPTRALIMSAMQFAEPEPDPNDPNEPKEPKEAADMVKCPKCGKMNPAGASDCSECGASLPAKKAADVGDTHVNTPIKATDYSAEQRREMAKKGEARPDGSFPIANAKDVENAVHDWGRAGSNPADKAHIISRAKALGATGSLPDDWKPGGKKAVELDEATKAFVEEQTKKLSEELEAEKGSRKAAEERLAHLEGESQSRRFTDIIMGRDAAGDGAPPFIGKHETHHKVMATLARTYGEESDEFKEYVGEARAAAETLRKAGTFGEVGRGSGPDQLATGAPATKAFNEAVEAWMTANPDKNKGDAVQAIAKSKSRLYTDYIREKDEQAKKAPTSYGFDEEDK